MTRKFHNGRTSLNEKFALNTACPSPFPRFFLLGTSRSSYIWKLQHQRTLWDHHSIHPKFFSLVLVAVVENQPRGNIFCGNPDISLRRHSVERKKTQRMNRPIQIAQSSFSLFSLSIFSAFIFYILDQARRKSLQSYPIFSPSYLFSFHFLYLTFSGQSSQEDEK